MRSVDGPWPRDLPITVGIMYPTPLYGDADGFAREVQRLEALDPRVRVVVGSYLETEDRRSTRRDLTPAEAVSLPVELDDDQRSLWAGVDVVLGLDLPPGIGRIAPNLRWFQTIGSGSDHLPSSGLFELGARLTSSTGANAVAIAEFAFGRVIEAWKGFGAIAAVQTEHRWHRVFGRQLSGSALGLFGLGEINQAVATRAAAFGMDLLALRRSGPDGEPVASVPTIYGPGSLPEFLGQCDAVIAAVPDSPETRNVFDETAFAAMRPGAVFVNMGRGSLVDEEALVAALRSGHLAAAALDVTRHEPPPPDSPLWDAPNLRLSAHCSVVPSAMMGESHRLFAENLSRFLAGEKMRHDRTPADA